MLNEPDNDCKTNNAVFEFYYFDFAPFCYINKRNDNMAVGI